MNLEKQINDFINFKKLYISPRTLRLYNSILQKFNVYIKEEKKLTQTIVNNFTKKDTYKKNVITAFLKFSEIELKITENKKIIHEDISNYIVKNPQLSDNTIRLYSNQISAFYKHTGVKTLENFTNKDILNFLTGTEQNKRSKLNTLKRYFEFYNIRICDDIFLNKRECKNEQTEALNNRYLTEKELKKLKKWFEKETNNRQEKIDKMILYTSLNTGLRLIEITRAKVKHIKEVQMYVKGKNNKVRYVTLSDAFLIAIKKHIKANDLRDNDFLFPNRFGNQFSTNGLSNRLRKRFDKLKIENDGQATLHKLRHTYASQLVSAGVPLDYIATQLGHEDLNTTRIYAKSNLESKRRILNQNFSNSTITI